MGYFQSNKEAWEEAFSKRLNGWGDSNAERLKAEKTPFLDAKLVRELQDIGLEGKRVAQFCCNNGRELLSMMHLGPASGTGFDIAENIILQARETAEKAGTPNCEFIACNLLDIPETNTASFDLVLFTIGAVTWFYDLKPLFDKVALCLRPGGTLLIEDDHPFVGMIPLPGEPAFDEAHLNQLTYPYFRDYPWIENEGIGYISGNYPSKTFTSFSHTMADIINQAIASGFRLQKLVEFDESVGVAQAYDKKGLPLSYLLRADKKA